MIDKNLEIMTARLARDHTTLVLAGLGHAPWLVRLPERQIAAITLYSDDWVKSADLSPDGKWLVGGANGGAIFLWKVSR